MTTEERLIRLEDQLHTNAIETSSLITEMRLLTRAMETHVKKDIAEHHILNKLLAKNTNRINTYVGGLAVLIFVIGVGISIGLKLV